MKVVFKTNQKDYEHIRPTGILRRGGVGRGAKGQRGRRAEGQKGKGAEGNHESVR